jgi:Protein of unknown function (DUF2283)
MNTIYFENDDILEIRFSDAPAAKEFSKDWNTCISLDAAGNIVQMVVLDAKKIGAYPVQINKNSIAASK